jgi:hypothetical protein
MTNATHTPGPWRSDWQFIVAPDPAGVHQDIYIAEIAETDEDNRVAPSEQQQANARLIAAAPDLLDALAYFYNIIHDYPSSIRKGYVKHAKDMAREALAKAKGGAI